MRVALLLLTAIVRAAASQDTGQSRAVVGAGMSVMEFDSNGEAASRGIALRGGLAAHWIADITVVAQYWPDLGPWRAGSVALEATLFPAGRTRIAPFIQFGLGHFRATGDFGVTLTESGLAKTFGLGVVGRVWKSFGLRVEGVVRFDPGNLDDELRLGLVTAPRVPRPDGLEGGGAQAAIYSLTPFTGPWHPVEPGFGLAFDMPVGTSTDGTADVLLLHWHTDPNSTFSGWDTRAVVVLPALAWLSGRGGTVTQLGAGPVATLMFEGPDDGLRGGIHAFAGLRADVGAGFFVSARATLIWLVRSTRPGFVAWSQLGAEDERALMLRFGIGR